MVLPRLAVLCIVLVLAGCSGSKGPGTRTKAPNSNLILPPEIQQSYKTNAYDLIRDLRPFWLRSRGKKSINQESASFPVVYINGSRHGGTEVLSSVSVQNIKEIRYYNSRDATTRFGSNHISGAIAIEIF